MQYWAELYSQNDLVWDRYQKVWNFWHWSRKYLWVNIRFRALEFHRLSNKSLFFWKVAPIAKWSKILLRYQLHRRHRVWSWKFQRNNQIRKTWLHLRVPRSQISTYFFGKQNFICFWKSSSFFEKSSRASWPTSFVI